GEHHATGDVTCGVHRMHVGPADPIHRDRATIVDLNADVFHPQASRGRHLPDAVQRVTAFDPLNVTIAATDLDPHAVAAALHVHGAPTSVDGHPAAFEDLFDDRGGVRVLTRQDKVAAGNQLPIGTEPGERVSVHSSSR